MEIKTAPLSFTQLSLKSPVTNSVTTRTASLTLAQNLDKPVNKYSTNQWKYEPVQGHYRNTFVEDQTANYLKRLNKI
ncbi:hypothetical protein [Bacteriovorax sp. Seq25_V]|uniref:hypothetical protein n=1 Tax=Bacteriovorax sp. Seq25_V TaxID=1201288 RepID=UPI00038A3DB5|nr:hypothetical protein [Bacteriovorax sp. Seq25_V]EQC46228.1 hypothetical protein M900_1627 [Bacteriovorax sp. Seq25_V]